MHAAIMISGPTGLQHIFFMAVMCIMTSQLAREAMVNGLAIELTKRCYERYARISYYIA